MSRKDKCLPSMRLDRHIEQYDVLDTCCGSKMFWLEDGHDNVLFADIRKESHVLCDGRDLEIKPDIKIDFREMPFPDRSFSLVVFDPPHLKSLGKDSWMAKKYGRLFPTWQDDIRQGFEECFRVLKPKGTLIFKWNETQITVSEILKLTNKKPLFGHISGKAANTHWITFMKRAKGA
jgi:ubiquinone/menaquinone biosynthesis C-methylase UbiE